MKIATWNIERLKHKRTLDFGYITKRYNKRADLPTELDDMDSAIPAQLDDNIATKKNEC